MYSQGPFPVWSQGCPGLKNHYLMGKAVKEILLCHHFIPVPVHLLPKVGVLTLFQLDQSCDLSAMTSHPFRTNLACNRHAGSDQLWYPQGLQRLGYSHLSIECIFSEVLDLLLKAGKKFFYLLVNSFRAETIWVEAQVSQAHSHKG